MLTYFQYYSYNDDGTWSGPYFQWSRARGTGENFGNTYAFFYDEWNGRHKQNCYADMCANDPCNGMNHMIFMENIISAI